jgi:hypothetical protein
VRKRREGHFDVAKSREVIVFLQCLNIFKTGVVQRRRLESHLNKTRFAALSSSLSLSLPPINSWIVSCSEADIVTPRIHGLVFDPSDGILKKLDINWKEAMNKHQKVYNLYDVPK